MALCPPTDICVRHQALVALLCLGACLRFLVAWSRLLRTQNLDMNTEQGLAARVDNMMIRPQVLIIMLPLSCQTLLQHGSLCPCLQLVT